MTVKAARVGLWLAALFVVLVLGAWMVMPVFVSSEFVRTAVERELADITGQRIDIVGRVDIDLFPSPVARLHDLHIPRDVAQPDARYDDFLAVDVVEVAIPMASLFARVPAFSQFRLVRPVMRIATNDSGRIDLDAIGGRLGRAITRLQRDSEDAGNAPSARFGTVTIENGTVEFTGAEAAEPEKITGIGGMVSWPRLNDRLTASLKGIWRGAAFEQKTEIDNAIHFLASEITGVRLNFTSDLLTYAFDGKMGIGDNPFAEGSVTLNTPSMRQALDWLQIGIHSGRAMGAAGLSGTIRADARKVRFENLELAVQNSKGKGVLEIAFKDTGKPSVTGTLDFVEIDIPSYLSALSGFPRDVGAIDDPVPMAIIDQMDIDLRLSAASAKAGPLQFANIAAVTQIRNGTAVFEMPDANAYGGKVQANFKLARDGDTLTGSFGLTCSKVNSAAIGDAFGFSGLFPRGLATGSLDIKAPIERWSDMLKRANGTMDFSVANGLFSGIGFQTLSGDGQSQTFFRLQDHAQTSDVFAAMNVKALVQEGVIIIQDGMIDYPAGTIQLNGVIPYGTASIALTTIAKPKADESDAPKPVFQHFIGGSWSNPYATPVLMPRRDN